MAPGNGTIDCCSRTGCSTKNKKKPAEVWREQNQKLKKKPWLWDIWCSAGCSAGGGPPQLAGHPNDFSNTRTRALDRWSSTPTNPIATCYSTTYRLIIEAKKQRIPRQIDDRQNELLNINLQHVPFCMSVLNLLYILWYVFFIKVD